ncbi:MAG: 5-methyltetrahydropteroyltriglutamate--homocysteine S-methyltransferase [Gammaproteobacteria bacterium]
MTTENRSIAHNLGFPCIGPNREMKKAVEAYWRGEISQQELRQIGADIQKNNWQLQAEAGIQLIPVGDFSWYDRVLATSALLGVVPARFGQVKDLIDLDTFFCMARGQAPNGQEAPPCEMTKWFDTNYHYIVPEFDINQEFRITCEVLFKAVETAQQCGHQAKPVLLGPLSFLWLGKTKGQTFDKLTLLDKLLPVYAQILQRLQQQGVQWIQIDEPILALDLPEDWQAAFRHAYQQLSVSPIQSLLTTYFGALADNCELVCQLPVAGLHIDLATAPEQLESVLQHWPQDKVLSLGVVDGRNIWRADLSQALAQLKQAQALFGKRLWVAPSCSLLHVPVNVEGEQKLDPEIKSWLAFAKQKVEEVALLATALNEGEAAVVAQLSENQAVIASRRDSAKIHSAVVQKRITGLSTGVDQRQSVYEKRAQIQREAIKLPDLPTTTIGSFPQTKEIRGIRRDFKRGDISVDQYEAQMRDQIAQVITRQEELGLDVLVHGEAERTDMVEYFAQFLQGVVFTGNGWVQSYGSRCVKPPIIYGDVARKQPMTVAWSQYAQSLSARPVKGMLTGPVTILAWSFVRDDQPLADTTLQIALALRDEVVDLEAAGISIIQIDEPAFRETLPLRRKDWQAYLDWAARCFRISASGVKDVTQIHSHMCYSEFNDIIEAIAALDADVISVESSRSDMELLEAFQDFDYPNEIGPGVYDIHSPRIPSTEEVITLLKKALQYIPIQRLWVNPDCGLKTRGWKEVEIALKNMVAAARKLRDCHAN